ncbi:MAG: tetratricopeptide repeat protein [Rhodocyclaceae bacterium]|nr:MAG: tetratricopeptide repeat protein [Rhodocyclaceae bacterium]
MSISFRLSKYPSARTRLLGACCMTGALLVPQAARALSPQQVFTLASPAVVVLEVANSNGQATGSLTATEIGAGRFVTICEGLDTSGGLTLKIGAQAHAGRLAARDRERNLCLIVVDGLPSSGVALRRSLPATGSRVFALSNALGLGVGISEGVVAGIRRHPVGELIQFTAPISPGSEGGALVDDSGAVVGIIDYRRRDGQNVNFAAAIGWSDEIEARATAAAATLQRYDAASLLMKAGKWQELDAQVAEWIRREPDSTDAWSFRVAAARGLKQADRELEAWTALRRIAPERAEWGIGLVSALLAGGRRDEALALATTLAAEHRELAVVQLTLGRVRTAARLNKEAEVAYRTAIELDPWLIEAYRGLAELAQLRGDHATSISIWSRIRGLYPEASGPRFGLARAYINAAQPARALAVIERLPEAERDGAAAWFWRGIALAALERPEAAIEAYQACLARRFEEPDRAWAGIGFAHYRLKNYPDAIAAFKAAVEAQPAQDDWRYQLGVTLKDGGRPAEALAVFDELATRVPGEARNWRQKGFTLSVLARHKEALPALERSLQLDPAQPKVWEVLMAAQQALGQRDAARSTYDRLRAIDGKAAEEAYLNYLSPYEEAAR